MIIFGHQGGARRGSDRHHHIIISAGRGRGVIQHHHHEDKNMDFVPMFSIATVGIIRAEGGWLVSIEIKVVRDQSIHTTVNQPS